MIKLCYKNQTTGNTVVVGFGADNSVARRTDQDKQARMNQIGTPRSQQEVSIG
jgi:hypothetical protein